jgi:hypothetical protein
MMVRGVEDTPPRHRAFRAHCNNPKKHRLCQRKPDIAKFPKVPTPTHPHCASERCLAVECNLQYVYRSNVLSTLYTPDKGYSTRDSGRCVGYSVISIGCFPRRCCKNTARLTDRAIGVKYDCLSYSVRDANHIETRVYFTHF